MQCEKFRNHPVGVDAAAAIAWSECNDMVADFKQTNSLMPWSSSSCKYKIFDPSGGLFSCIAFNQAGNILAGGTTLGYLHLIGMHTLCCLASLNLLERSKHSLLPNSVIILLEFFNHDQLLNCICNNEIIIIDLVALDAPRIIKRVDLLFVWRGLMLSEDSVVYPVTRSFPGQTKGAIPNDEQDEFQNHTNATQLDQVGSPMMSPSPYNFLSEESLENALEQKSNLWANSKRGAEQQVVNFCKVIKFVEDTKTKTHVFECIIIFAICRLVTSPPLRFIWEKNCLSSSVCVLPSTVLHSVSRSSLRKDRMAMFTVALFTFKNLNFDFQVDKSSGFYYSEIKKKENEAESLSKNIMKQNSKTCFNSRMTTHNCSYSYWSKTSERNLDSSSLMDTVYCAVGTYSGQIYLIELFESLEEEIPPESRLCSSLELGSMPLQLVTNLKGSIIICRAVDRVFLIRIESFDSSCSAELSLKIIYTYQEAIQKEKFSCVEVSRFLTNYEACIISGGKMGATVSFLATNFTQRAQESNVMLKLNFPKIKNFKQISWCPSTHVWGGLTLKEGCIMFFSPSPPSQIWSLMIPGFQYLWKNREVIEAEDEFDDLVWLNDQQNQSSENQDLTVDAKKAVSYFHDQPWFTCLNSDLKIFSRYPFCGPLDSYTELPNPNSHSNNRSSEDSRSKLNKFWITQNSEYQNYYLSLLS